MTGWIRHAARMAGGMTAAGLLAGTVLAGTVLAGTGLAAIGLAAIGLAGSGPAWASAGAAGAGTAAAPVGESFTILPTPAPGATKLVGDISLIVFPGHTYPESVSVINYARTTATFWLYAADAYTIKDGGGFAVTGLKSRPRDVGAWVSALPKVIRVPGHKQLNIAFTIHVPASAIPGQHAGGIVIEDTSPQLIRVNSTLRVRRYTQVFTRMYITVAGRVVPDFDIDGMILTHPQPPFPVVTSRSGSIYYALSDTGNAILAPTVTLKVTDLFGTVMDRTFPATSQILPGDLASYSVPWRDVPAIGPVHVYLTARSTYGLTRTVVQSYFAVPVPFAGSLAALAVLLALLAVLLVRRRRHRAGAGRRGPRASAPAATGRR